VDCGEVTHRDESVRNDNARKGRSFESLAEMNEFLRRWNRRVARQRIHAAPGGKS
jgi:hypothetical protein